MKSEVYCRRCLRPFITSISALNTWKRTLWLVKGRVNINGSKNGSLLSIAAYVPAGRRCIQWKSEWSGSCWLRLCWLTSTTSHQSESICWKSSSPSSSPFQSSPVCSTQFSVSLLSYLIRTNQLPKINCPCCSSAEKPNMSWMTEADVTENLGCKPAPLNGTTRFSTKE